MNDELEVLKAIHSQLWVIQWTTILCTACLVLLVIFKVGKGSDE